MICKKQLAADSYQLSASSRQQTADSRQQTADSEEWRARCGAGGGVREGPKSQKRGPSASLRTGSGAPKFPTLEPGHPPRGAAIGCLFFFRFA